jgi:Kdo2-lipid IVA lauroyltransferase/acyltransferase
MSLSDRGRLCRRTYRHFGMMAVEVCRLLRDPAGVMRSIVIDGRENLDTVMATAGRALVLTAHLGNWELLTLVPRLTGHAGAIVVRPLEAPWLEAVMRRARASGGAGIIGKRAAARPVVQALRGGGLVAILLDQNAARREGVFVPFFGRTASTSRSVAVLALRTGVPIVPMFIRRERSGRHRITIQPAISRAGVSSGEDAVVELTRRCTEAIERAVCETPEQWLWMHDRWRTRPPVERRVPS